MPNVCNGQEGRVYYMPKTMEIQRDRRLDHQDIIYPMRLDHALLRQIVEDRLAHSVVSVFTIDTGKKPLGTRQAKIEFRAIRSNETPLASSDGFRNQSPLR